MRRSGQEVYTYAPCAMHASRARQAVAREGMCRLAKKRPLTQALCLDSLGLDGGDFFFVFFVFVSPPSEAVRRCEGTLPLRFEL